MPLKQAGDISIIASQCHSLEHPQSTSKHWLKRRKIMTVNNKKESWLSHGQDPARCLPPLSLPFSRASALSLNHSVSVKITALSLWHRHDSLQQHKGVYGPMHDCYVFKKVFAFEMLARWGQLGSVQSAGAFIPVYSQGKCKKPFSCHPSLILPPLYAIVYGLLLRITSLFFFLSVLIHFRMK